MLELVLECKLEDLMESAMPSIHDEAENVLRRQAEERIVRFAL